jgi:transferase CAF17, mitochondrial
MNLCHVGRTAAKPIQSRVFSRVAGRHSPARPQWSFGSQRFSSNQAQAVRGSNGFFAASGLAKLEHRGLISVVGEDATRLLQGLLTNSMNNMESKSGMYAAFLNAQGRILTDSFIYRIPARGQDQKDGYLVEVDKAILSNLLQYLQTHRLRSKVTLRILPKDEFTVWTAWDNNIGRLAASSEWQSQILQMADPRLENFSHRMLLPTQRTEEDHPQKVLPDAISSLPVTGSDSYQARRYLHGLAEGIPDIVPNKSLPHEYNMDHLNGIDFQKGCYVGQELTIRTQHTGVVRKRILPAQVFDAQSEPPLVMQPLQASAELDAASIPRDTKIRPVGRQKTAAGKWTAGLGNVGLAVCRLEMMTDIRVSSDEGEAFKQSSAFELAAWEDGVGQTHQGLGLKPFVPEWLRSKLQKP